VSTGEGSKKAGLVLAGFAFFSLAYWAGGLVLVEEASRQWRGVGQVVVLAVAVALYAWLLARVIDKRRNLVAPPGRRACFRCGYDRRGLAMGAPCPECGERGGCAWCGYDRRGLSETALCPECGRAGPKAG
jgi:hypothetical protein